MTTQNISRFVSRSLSNLGDHTMTTRQSFSNLFAVIFVVTAMVVLSTASEAQAAEVYTYAYDAGAITYAGDDGATEFATPDALNDGNISVDATLPATPWDAGNYTVLYGLADNSLPQPGLTLTLGGSTALDRLDIYYTVRQASSVHAPDTVAWNIDGGTDTVFAGFDNSANVATGGDARFVSIDLSGNIGTTIQLDFRSDVQWVGISEIQVFALQTAPEPSTFLLATLGLMGLCVRRRRRNRG